MPLHAPLCSHTRDSGAASTASSAASLNLPAAMSAPTASTLVAGGAHDELGLGAMADQMLRPPSACKLMLLTHNACSARHARPLPPGRAHALDAHAV